MSQFWWIIYPYLALAIMIIGTVYRYRYNQMGWGSKSSELLEKRLLRPGSLLFHWGIVFVLIGHAGGLLVPLRFYHWIGLPDEVYHWMADVVGGLVGVAAWLGVVLLLIRRIGNHRVRRNSSISDFVVLFLLLIVITLGDLQTVFYNNLHGAYEYRETVGPWLRGLLSLRPDASLMADVPCVENPHRIYVCPVCRFAILPAGAFLQHPASLPSARPNSIPVADTIR